MSKAPDEASLRKTTRALESCGYVVERIPEGELPTPDLLALDPAASHIPPLAVEVKSNEDPPLEFDADGVAHFSRSMSYSNALSGVIRKAGCQLAHAPSEALRVVCYCTTGLQPEVKADEVKATLYGLVHVIALRDASREIPCFYFDRAEFLRQREIAAALLIVGNGGLLCINEFCSRETNFRSTALWRWHEQEKAVRDPRAEEVAGRSFRVDAGVFREHEDDVLAHLTMKYKTGRLITFRPKHYGAVGMLDAD